MINAWDVRVCWGNQPSALYLPQRCIWGAGTQNPPKCPRAPNCVSSLWSYGLQKQSSPKKLSPKNVPQIVCPLCEESAVPKKDVAQKGSPNCVSSLWRKCCPQKGRSPKKVPQNVCPLCEGLGPGRRISRMLGWDEAGATAVQHSAAPQAVSSCSSSVCYVCCYA